jgi:hypothetical protein
MPWFPAGEKKKRSTWVQNYYGIWKDQHPNNHFPAKNCKKINQVLSTIHFYLWFTTSWRSLSTTEESFVPHFTPLAASKARLCSLFDCNFSDIYPVNNPCEVSLTTQLTFETVQSWDTSVPKLPIDPQLQPHQDDRDQDSNYRVVKKEVQETKEAGEERFRKNLIKHYFPSEETAQCFVTGSELVVKTAQIRPWNEYEDEHNVDNGLLLNASWHALLLNHEWGLIRDEARSLYRICLRNGMRNDPLYRDYHAKALGGRRGLDTGLARRIFETISVDNLQQGQTMLGIADLF